MHISTKHKWTPVLGFVALLFVIGAGQGVARDLPYAFNTRHYTIKTDAGKRIAHLVAQHMESIYGEYARRFRDYGLKEHKRFEVRVYSKEKDYNHAVPEDLVGSTGAFLPDQKWLGAYLEGHTEEEAFRTLYHEGFHQFLFSCVTRNVPLWLNEGFAVYFSEATWDGDSFETGLVPRNRIFVVKRAIKEKRHISFEKLFERKSEQWLGHVRNSESLSSLQYCEAWSVVHFLLHSERGRYRKRLFAYLKKLSQDKDAEKAFRASFGVDYRRLERKWIQYVKKLQPGATELCRSNMELLGTIALGCYGSARRFRSLEHLRRELSNPRRQWKVVSGYGRKVSSEDKKSAAGLFRCPYDRSKAKISYVLLKNKNTGLPELFCNHHKGVVVRGYYQRGENGKLQMKVETIVRATLPQELLRKLE